MKELHRRIDSQHEHLKILIEFFKMSGSKETYRMVQEISEDLRKSELELIDKEGSK